MSRTAGRTSLILGAQDATDLLMAVDEVREQRQVAIADLIVHPEYEEQARAMSEEWTRLCILKRRILSAQSRLERGRNGRSAAAQ